MKLSSSGNGSQLFKCQSRCMYFVLVDRCLSMFNTATGPVYFGGHCICNATALCWRQISRRTRPQGNSSVEKTQQCKSARSMSICVTMACAWCNIHVHVHWQCMFGNADGLCGMRARVYARMLLIVVVMLFFICPS